MPGFPFQSLTQKTRFVILNAVKNPTFSMDESPLPCHSERSEESCALNRRIIIKNRNHCHNSTTHTHSRDSSSPKSSFRMTIKEEYRILKERITFVCHSERSEESCVLHGPIIIKSRIHFYITNPHSRCRDSSSPKSSFRMTIKERLVRNDKTPQLVILNAVKNLAFSIDVSPWFVILNAVKNLAFSMDQS